MARDNLEELIEAFKAQDRRALAQTITMVESNRFEDQQKAAILLARLLSPKKSIRIAISGPPGVGKSTFINALGTLLIKKFAVAILPIDPSSDLNKGSILGDKTRMGDLVDLDRIYIRPSPSQGNLGGISIASFDVILLMEAFGFDFVIIETVGVGQSETIASLLADHFIVLMQPGAGDQLQAMKKGILEKADFVLVNKADGELLDLAKNTKSSLKSLNGFLHNKQPVVSIVSAQEKTGLEKFLTDLLERHENLVKNGRLDTIRKKNREQFFDYYFDQVLARRIKDLPYVNNQRREIMKDYQETSLSSPINQLIENICQALLDSHKF
jgi:LAO/AO transport system kinase